MTNVLVDDSYLSDIADTIRAKLGVADTYLPSEMADAIDDIGGGVTPTGTKQISISANGTTTEDVAAYASAQITVAVPSASLGTKSITANGTYNAASDSLDGYSSVTVNVSGGGGTDNLAAFCNGTLTRLDDDNITDFLVSLRGSSFNLGSIFLKNLKELTVGYCFGNNKYTTAVFPSLEKTNSSGYYFSGANSLTKVDIGPTFSTETAGLRNSVFNGASAMNVLILRNTTLVPLANIGAFSNTPFASGKAGGTLYVPSALVSSYQSASNWSTILGYTDNQIKSIESTHTDQTAPIDLTLYYADGTPIA